MDLLFCLLSAKGISTLSWKRWPPDFPVIATNVGGNPELVRLGQSGELVPHSVPVILARAIAGYFQEPYNRARYGIAGRRRVETDFSMESMVQGYLQTYDAVLREVAPNRIATEDRILLRPEA